jgi:hypothetical protein
VASGVSYVGPVQRWIRRTINPLSTGLTVWWHGAGIRRVPPRPLPIDVPSARPRLTTYRGVRSPGDWTAPRGLRPGWDWLPEHGAIPRLRAMPRWVRLWYRTPFLDRYAYEWMWWHGGWSVLVPAAPVRPPHLPD